MERPQLGAIKEAVGYVDSIRILRNTIILLVAYIEHIEKEETDAKKDK